MNKKQQKTFLKNKLQEFADKGFDILANHIDTTPLTHKYTIDNKTYQIEIECFYDTNTKDTIRVIASIDDGSLFRSIFPYSCGMLVQKDRQTLSEFT